ncbi:MAG: hypothetical protein ACRENP_17615 [Longimicrobiales bacterium]
MRRKPSSHDAARGAVGISMASAVTEDRAIIERVWTLSAQLDTGLSDPDVVRELRDILGEVRRRLSISDAILSLLAHHGASKPLLAEAGFKLAAARPPQTIKGLARHSGRDETTLRRHWKRLCPDAKFHCFNQLLLLARFLTKAGSPSERAQALDIDIRVLRSNARALTGMRLEQLAASPCIIIEVLEMWLRPNAGDSQ